MRATLDTNLYVTACISPDGPSARIIAHWRNERFDLSTSDPILTEFDEALSRERIRRFVRQPRAWIATLRHDLHHRATRVVPEAVQAARDPDDDPILGTAIAASADYLVIGDRDLLDLGSFRGIPIITARQFLGLLEGANDDAPQTK